MNEFGQKLWVRCLTRSLDGYVAGTNQSMEKPMGENFDGLHGWMIATTTGAAMFGDSEGEEGLDEDYVARSFEGFGAVILGRNMFTPSRGPWTDDGWTGWWGPDPVYHSPTFVVTHHVREPIPMAGGTTFNFVTDGIDAALERAFAAADGADVRLVGGASTVRQYLDRGLIDELHVVTVPVTVGAGELLFGKEVVPDGYAVTRSETSTAVTHTTFEPIPSALAS